MATMFEESKEHAVEFQRPLAGDRSPSSDAEEQQGHEHSSTRQDNADMHRLGRKQELNRNFQTLSTLGLTCVIMGTWMGMIASSSFSLIDGGRGGTVWTYIATWFFQIFVISSMAEMASMAPTSAGQYHWVSEFAPPNIQNFMSYISGWLSALGWQSNIAVTAYVTANLMLALGSLYSDYSPTYWQQTLLMIALVLFAVFFNAFGAKNLPSFEGAILFFDVIGFFAVLIPLWVLAPKVSAHDIFLTFVNGGDWSSVGAACIVGVLAPAGAFIGADSAAHLSEEVSNASLTVPRVMFFTVVLNGAFGLVAIVSYVACIQSVQEQILESTDAFPFMGVFHTATGSRAATVGMTIPFIVLAYSMTLNSVAAASRQAWAFGRDGGLPFSSWFQKVRSIRGTPLPINAMISTLIMSIVLALINLGGAEAFNSINGLISGAIALTYALSIGCVLYRRLFGEPLPYARWSLGRFGVIVNATGFLFEMFVMVISFFPLFNHPTAKTMNWGIAMFGGAAIICSVYYIVGGRKTYKGPVARIKHD